MVGNENGKWSLRANLFTQQSSHASLLLTNSSSQGASDPLGAGELGTIVLSTQARVKWGTKLRT